jgi:hypothetical protein
VSEGFPSGASRAAHVHPFQDLVDEGVRKAFEILFGSPRTDLADIFSSYWGSAVSPPGDK